MILPGQTYETRATWTKDELILGRCVVMGQDLIFLQSAVV
jgi:hypothetical protein